MYRAILLLVLFVVGGCGGATASRDWAPPSNAQVFTETARDAYYASSGPAPQGTLYVYDQGRGRLLYRGAIRKNESVRLYEDHAMLLPSTRPSETGKVIAKYSRGQHVKAYVMESGSQ